MREQRGYVSLMGWASDGAHRKPADLVVVFVNGEADHDRHTVWRRKDIATRFEAPSLVESGFRISLPRFVFERDPTPIVRVFAVSSTGVASELGYRPEYQYPGGTCTLGGR